MATHPKGDNVTKTVSMDTDLLHRAEDRRKTLRLPSFSYYVRKLIADDLAARGEMILREQPAPYTTKPRPK